MKVHVLAGDSLAGPFKETGIDGEVVICRECFVDGDVDADNLNELWILRDEYLSRNYSAAESEYETKVRAEFERLLRLSTANEVVLWFEYELFCQVNLWFTIWLLRNTGARFSISYPRVENESEILRRFGLLGVEELRKSYESRVRLGDDDVSLAIKLWESFQKSDFEAMRRLATVESVGFPTLKLVVEAACEIETRPRNSILKIIENGKSEFADVFQEFCQTEAVYGFGDLQVKRIFDETRMIEN